MPVASFGLGKFEFFQEVVVAVRAFKNYIMRLKRVKRTNELLSHSCTLWAIAAIQRKEVRGFVSVVLKCGV